MPLKLLRQFGAAYTLVTLGFGAMAIGLSPPLVYQATGLLMASIWVSFMAPLWLLDILTEKNKDDAYLYYLGVSGLRMLVFLAGLGLTLYFMPYLRHKPMVLSATTAYLVMTGIEVTGFVRKLREIFRNELT